METCSHGVYKRVRCEFCVNEGVYTHAAPTPLSAEEQLLYEAVLRVIDDGWRGHRNTPWGLYAQNEDMANVQRMDFAEAVIATWNRFKRDN